MNRRLKARVEEAKEAALAVLLNNLHGPFDALPRTAGWGYPEPYTRDMMISALGFLASGNEELLAALRRVLEVLARNRTEHGHIPSLANDAFDLGASDTTPLFLMALGLYRRVTGEHEFLAEAAAEARTWMTYQSPSDEVIVGQLPTSDWRDEQWVLGFGLFVNTIVYAYLRLFGENVEAAQLRVQMNQFTIRADPVHQHIHQGLIVPHKPYYALWSYKVYGSERFDLLGNSLAIITGIATRPRARLIVNWIEQECAALQARGELAVHLPPNLFPYIQPTDPDWLPRYASYNRPGEYHNGGVWPFICGFYVVAVLAAGFPRLAEKKLEALTDLVHPAHNHDVAFGFNEWIRAQDGTAQGNDWQTWSAAMYLYAALCVEQKKDIYFDEIRQAT